MLKQKNYLRCLIFFMAALVLAGCTPYGSTAHWSSAQVYPLEGKLSLMKRLAAYDVQVVEQGDHLRIIIPSDDFFDVDKSALWMSKEPALELVAKLVLLYGNTPVLVQGFSNNIENEASNMKRTTQQANDVAAVLWSYGVDQRRLRVQGYASKFPIANNRTVEGRRYNHRVEIKI